MESSCSTFTLYELTGAYASTNTTGWGSPNATTSSITGAVLQVTTPSGALITIDLITHSFPSSNTSYSYDITAASLGGYEDGKWEFLLYYTDGVDYYMKKHVRLFYCNTECCVTKMLSNILISDCDCCENDISIKKYLKAKVFLEALKNAAKCYQIENFTSIKKILDKLCANSDCKTCK